MIHEERFQIKDPVHVLRVCRVVDGALRPTIGDSSFVWPSVGAVSDDNFLDTAVCGRGLHGCLSTQIAESNKTNILNPSEIDLAYLVVEVERDELVVIDNVKVKFPRGNVLFAGSWRACLQLLRDKGEEGVPSDEEMYSIMSWRTTLEPDESKLLDSFKPLEMDGYCPVRDGSQDNPTTFKEYKSWAARLKAKENLSKADAEVYADAMIRANAAVRYSFWKLLQKNVEFLFLIHPLIEKLMVESVAGKSGKSLSDHNQNVSFTSQDALRAFERAYDKLLGHFEFGLSNIDPDIRKDYSESEMTQSLSWSKSELAARLAFRLFNQPDTE